MAGDFNKPSSSSLYTAFAQEIRDLCSDVAKMLYSSSNNVPIGTIRYNATTKQLEAKTANPDIWAQLDLIAPNAKIIKSNHEAAGQDTYTVTIAEGAAYK